MGWSVVGNDPHIKNIGWYRSKAFPWSDKGVAEAKVEEQQRIEVAKQNQHNLQFLKGSNGRDGLQGKGGAETKVDTLAALGSDAVVGLFFAVEPSTLMYSATAASKYRGLTAQLIEYYNQLKNQGKVFEVVFISWDYDNEQFNRHFEEMPWLALPHSERDVKMAIDAVFGLELWDIPTLILLRADGTLIAKCDADTLSQNMQRGFASFPWVPEDM